MRATSISGLRLVISLGFAGAGVFAILEWTSSWPAKLHGMMLAACAVIFGFSERLFWNILSEVNSAVRSTSLSVVEAERLRAIIGPAKLRLWRRWFCLTLFQVIAAASATLLISGYYGSLTHFWLLTGYGAVFMSMPILASFYQNFRNLEKFRDDFAMEEVKKRERVKLATELKKEPVEDHNRDSQLQGYTTVGS